MKQPCLQVLWLHENGSESLRQCRCSMVLQTLVSAVFYLPDVINDMPSDTPERVAGIPAAGYQGFAGSWPAQHGGNLFSHSFESAEVIHLERLVAHADFACVSPFGFDDVAADLVTAATAAPRSLAQVFYSLILLGKGTDVPSNDAPANHTGTVANACASEWRRAGKPPGG